MSEPIEDEEDVGTRRMDPELKAMGQMLRTLNEVPESARGRIVTWLAARYSADKGQT